MWDVGIYNTRSGSPEFEFKTTGPLVAANATRVLGSKGSGVHTLNLRGTGMPKSLIDEISRGNKYTIAQRWGDHIAYAGVTQNDKWDEDSCILRLASNELRAAILGVRNPHGVNEYNPASGVLNVSGRSRNGAVRVILNAATKNGSVAGWELPIDIPADAAGSFNAAWRHEEKLTTEHLLSQVEDDGVETDLAPYLTAGGYLRYEAKVAVQIASGTPFTLAAKAPGSIVMGVNTEKDYVAQRTGLLGLGKGQGQDAIHTFAPLTGDGIGDLPVMDSNEAFPDVSDPTRLQAATNTSFARRNAPVEQWNYQLYIGGVGPAMAAPGSIHDMQIFGSYKIADGSHPQRVISLGINLSNVVKPGVQAYG